MKTYAEVLESAGANPKTLWQRRPFRNVKLVLRGAVGAFVLAAGVPSWADDHVLHHFDRIELTDVYYSEGAHAGDIDGDGVADVVHGPYWFKGPDFQVKQEIYPAKAQPRQAYADNFFSWVHDFNNDGHNDVLAVGFPGTPAYVYENPRRGGLDRHWTKHQVFDWVSNESPQFVDLVEDETPELICTRDGFFGYAVIDQAKPFEAWQFHKISQQTAPKRFGHGLGVGDVDGDDRLDVLTKDGWFQQPASTTGDPQWTFHAVPFAPRGGADMFAYDVDGDGDNDVITSLAAHEFGLSWHEQIRIGDSIGFREHLIMGDTPEDNPYGVLFSELHSVNLVDMDGDGLKDIVTGKTYWSHHTKSPMWDAGAVVYWFKLVRGDDGVDWIPFQANGDTGIGRQLTVKDVNGDQLPDIVVGGMKGANVLVHRVEKVDDARWQQAQPKKTVKLASGLTPREAARQMTVPDGFEVMLAAGEPQVHQPIAMAFDARGRLWIAEAHTYPIRAPEGQGKDKIIILEDTTGDGHLDSRKMFMDGLNLVSGLEVGFGGVWVGAAPYLLFIPDGDGDDQPDSEPRILLDGFGYHDTHETLNAFNWGPDGWLYGCHGVFTHSRVGKPGSPDAERTPMNAGIWRYHPQRHEFEVFAWGTSNPWGVDFDDQGQAFCTACVIPHLFHVIQGARYQRQAGQHFNPYVFGDIRTIADHVHYAGNIRDHAWWGSEPVLPQSTSAAGGGHAHAGAMIYLGDNWPRQYRNQLFMCNIHGNRVNADVLERQGSGFVGRHGADLLLANDHWFRGINLRYGPDGSVLLIDWYDRNACHRNNPEIWDRTNGRVYRISYGEAPDTDVDLAKLSEGELVSLLRHKNDWYVRMARRLLQERGGSNALHDSLRTLLDTADSSALQLRALWALHVTDGFSEELAQSLLSHANEYLRAWAIQLQLEDRRASSGFIAQLSELARSDSSPVVRLYLASAMQRLSLRDRWPIMEGLVRHAEDEDDHNLPLMYWYALEPMVAEDPRRAMALARVSKIGQLSRFIIRRAAAGDGNLEAVVDSLSSESDTDYQLLILDEIRHSFQGRVDIAMPKAWASAYEPLRQSGNERVRDRADEIAVILGDKRIFPRLRDTLVDAAADSAKRKQALQILVRGRDRDAAAAFQAVLDEPALRGPAIRALAAHDDPKTPEALLRRYHTFAANEKSDAVATLVSRPSYAIALLDSVARDVIPRTDLHAYHIRQMTRFENEEISQRISDAWGIRTRNVAGQTEAYSRTHDAAPRRTYQERQLRQWTHGLR